ncbi:MAG TPA: helix-turn-helix domain-containing protein [Bacteroidales bacterium]|nr:helix-turn-helix domain-containing protein [Bacteroidales bacterium]
MSRHSEYNEAFIRRITEIIEANLRNEKFGVTELSREVGISRTNLYNRVKTITSYSVCRLITKIRLKKAMELLEDTSSSVSEIAYEVGFGSPTYFIKCFHDYYGFPPGGVKKDNKQESVPIDKKTPHRNPDFNFRKKKSWVKLTGTIFIFALFIFIFILKPFSTHSKKNTISIAVFPLRNLSNDQESELLANGIIEDIILRLSQEDKFNIKSSSTVLRYINKDKAMKVIANEMGVSYVLEGSILNDTGRIRMYIQLIDAVNDKHIWSQQYDSDLGDIFPFITDVSDQIAHELKNVFSERENKHVGKLYPKNQDAYNLYLKGRFFLNRRREVDVKKSINYFEQALAVEPNNSLAYAGMADGYFIMTWWNWYPRPAGWQKSKHYALRALEFNHELAEAHTVLGAIATWAEKDWVTAEKEFKLAIDLNPDFPTAHQYYAELLLSRGRLTHALQECNIAIAQDPNAISYYMVRAAIHYFAGNFKASLDDNRKILEFNKNLLTVYFDNLFIYTIEGEDTKALEELKRIFALTHTNPNAYPDLNDVYSKQGLKGILYIFLETFVAPDDYLEKSRVYSLTGEWNKVLENIGQIAADPNSIQGLCIKYGYEFKPLKNNPDFIALMHNMGLEDL